MKYSVKMFTVYCSNQSDPLKFRFLLKERDHQAVTLVNFPRASLVPPAYLDKEELYLEKFALKLVDLPDGFLMENDPIFLFNRIKAHSKKIPHKLMIQSYA